MASTSASGKAAIFRTVAHARKSTNRFQTGRVIPSEILRDILDSTMRAPSSFNLQPTQIILVQSKNIKDALSDQVMLGAGNQFRVKDCSVLAVFLADLEAGKRIKRIYQLEQDAGGRHPNYMASMPIASSFLLGEGHAATFAKNLTTEIMSKIKPMPQIESSREWSYKNTSLATQSYMLAATSHDLATTPMEGFDPRRAMEVLRIPDRYAIPMMVATGYDYDEGKNFTPRLGLNESVFGDTFGAPLVLDSTTEDVSQTDENLQEVA
mmetsp:Transcript_7249/g.9453  ORF Transcript_7249/g.9453 Transcript_7249/m.9453 type:complete len:266 (+) Transcript_7249:54-851(+)|eukprot:CAMPEP_0198144308 /NCGR_PEP_ID=MMETSP1443-20131203/14363_1 /TAXON_ID=186043 /ORGANISM="Entomoneis sp., Strain CCMP2396" /LENGTH=265 /DNA_ID=CAMNT_0043807671 /DNA_START=12 /DNA_END=809 /DNA_ORIENTATION=-